MVYKILDHRNSPRFGLNFIQGINIKGFYNNMEKVREKLALFSVEKVRVFIVCTLTDNKYEPISGREF